MTNNDLISSDLYRAIADVIQQARQQVKQAVNQQMVQAYWQMDMYRMYGMSRWHGCQGATMYVRMYEEELQQEIEREREKITRVQESQARYVAE